MKIEREKWKLVDLGTERVYEILKTEKIGLAYAEIHESKLHKHRKTTEIYIVDEGEGTLYMGEDEIQISKGDIVKISPETPHKVKSSDWVRLYVISSPPWSEEDHELLE